ncbi:MAG: flippase-like domain-containing protein [Proteobacteria bacterium]|nr:MAG: flippase-like domain-containing protein [Pseudomonadota bacterium]
MPRTNEAENIFRLEAGAQVFLRLRHSLLHGEIGPLRALHGEEGFEQRRAREFGRGALGNGLGFNPATLAFAFARPGLNFSFGQVMRYGMIGQLFNTTMPGAVSGDLIKAWYVLADSKGHRKTPVLTSILLDRIMGVFGLVIVSASPILFFWSDVWSIERLHKMAFIVLALFVGVVFFFSYVLLSAWGPLAALRRKMEGLNKIGPGRILLQVYDSFVTYRERPLILFQALGLSICAHISVVSIIVLCGRTLGDDPLSIHQYFLLAPLGLFTTAVPVAPAGLGVGQVAFAALFALAGSAHGAEIFTMYVTMQILINLTGIFFYLRSPKPRSRHAEA